MRYISTNSSCPPATLADAVNRCVAPDGGLYVPEQIPVIPRALFNNISEMSLREIAFVVASSFFGNDVPAPVLKKITDEAFAFDAPLRRLHDDIYVLELFHGPTLTFKDYGARFMARLMKHLDGADRARGRNVLVATMGNTGAAAANGLFNLDGISVCVLYPKGVLNRSQTSQFTALGENIHPLEVAGTVEDCKLLVQRALADPSMSDFRLTGANSINLARLLPQITFTMYAYSRLAAMEVHGAGQAEYSMPCGNLSNLVAAAMAARMGTPVGRLIAAVNSNNQVVSVFGGASAAAGSKPVRTLAPSIDMVHPSGWPRLSHIYGGDIRAMKADILAADPVSDERIAEVINSLRSEHGYTIDPHGAVAYAAAVAQGSPGVPKVVFATGHPAKQLDIMTRITGSSIELPVQLTRFMSVRRHSTIIPPTVPALRKHLLSINS